MDPCVHLGLYWWTKRWRTGGDVLKLLPPPPGVEDSDEDYCERWNAVDDSVVLECDSLEDVHTEDLQYFLKSFLMAYSLGSGRSTLRGAERKKMLERAVQLFREHVVFVSLYKGSEREVNTWQAALRKEVRSREDAIQRRLSIKAAEEELPQLPAGLFSSERPDEQVRAFWLALIELSLHEAVSCIEQVHKEIEALDFIGASGSVTRPAGRPQAAAPPWVLRINDASELRAHFAAKTFTPSHALPTMSLDELVAKEFHQDVEILQAAQKRSQAKHEAARDSDQASEDSDQAERTSKTEKEQRDWDDWKDENPRGSGNLQWRRG